MKSTAKLWTLSLLMLLLVSCAATANAAVLCYGDLDANCARVDRDSRPDAGVVDLPGGFRVDHVVPTLLRITLERGTWAADPLVEGGTLAAPAVGQAPAVILCAAICDVTWLKVRDTSLQVLDPIAAQVELVNPNLAGLHLYSATLVLARIGGTETFSVAMVQNAGHSVQESLLRFSNTGPTAGQVTLLGLDDRGVAGDRAVLALDAGASVQLTSSDLEVGNVAKGLRGSFGDGVGKWRVLAATDFEGLVLQSYLRSGSTGEIRTVSDTVPGLH